jgi:hypothetical protein
MQMQNRMRFVSAFAAVVLIGVATTRAQASSITFSNGGSPKASGGLITVDNTVQIGDGSGGGSVQDGAISSVESIPGDFSLISGVCGVLGTYGCLELSTGTFIGTNDATPDNDYLYSGTGSYIRIYGDATAVAGESTLLYSGSFDTGSNVVLTFDDNNCPGPNCSASLTGTVDGGLLDPILAAYLGVFATTEGGNATTLFLTFSGISFPDSGAPTGTALDNTNSIQTFDVNQVPEPASLLLFSAGILGLAQIARRRKTRA